MIRFAETGLARFPSEGRVEPGTFHDPSARSTASLAAAGVMSPTIITVVFFGKNIVACHFITSSRVSAESDAFVPADGREYEVEGSNSAQLKIFPDTPSEVVW